MSLRPLRALPLLFVFGAVTSPLVAVEPKATTYPAQILIIRHAEKPPEESKSVDLSPEGMERASALPGLFKMSDKNANPFPKPDFIFATKNSKHSHRPLETVT